MARRVFLLSPAHTGGRRAEILLSPRAGFPLAHQLRARGGAPLGDVMAFLSGLYFRGKLAYARRFAEEEGAVLVITAGAGLLAPEARVTPARLRAFARCEIDAANPRFREPLVAAARALGPCEAVLLGSVASAKYVAPLLEVFGERLLFPPDFVGRGDMSRGGLLLRHAEEGRPLAYAPVQGAVRRGARPPKLAPRPRRPASDGGERRSDDGAG
jgi:hypothetical protein